MKTTKQGSRQPARRILSLVNALVRGETLDRKSAASLTGLREPAAYKLLRTLKALDGVVEVPGRRWAIRLPAVRLTEPTNEQVVAAAFGASLARLFRGSRYDQGMRDALRHVVQASREPTKYDGLERKFVFIRSCGEPSLPSNGEYLDKLVRAVLACRCVKVRYREFDGKVRNETVEPLALGVYDHQLYLLVRRESGSFHTIRFSRVLDVKVLTRAFAYPDAIEFSPDSFFASCFGIMRTEGPVEHVVVRLSAFWATYARSHLWHPSQRVEKAENGAADVHLDVRICEELMRWVLWFGHQAEVLQPDGLRDRVSEHAAGMARRNRAAGRRGA